jgi:uncharacterized protein YcbX
VRVGQIWRYPVKSMAGEQLAETELLHEGIPGDRTLYVIGAGGRIISARSRPALLGHHASIGEDGDVLVDGLPWFDPAVEEAVRTAAGPDAQLVPATGLERFDILPLLVATDGAIAALGYEGRRFRPNIVLAGVEGMAERGWDGRRLRIGADGVEVDLGHLCERCVITTFDPDTQEQDPDVLRTVNAELDGLFARCCWVARPGRIAVGDPAELV